MLPQYSSPVIPVEEFLIVAEVAAVSAFELAGRPDRFGQHSERLARARRPLGELGSHVVPSVSRLAAHGTARSLGGPSRCEPRQSPFTRGAISAARYSGTSSESKLKC
jgi:hypothetical protein